MTTPSQEEMENVLDKMLKSGKYATNGFNSFGSKMFAITPLIQGASSAMSGLIDAVKSTEKSYSSLTDSGASFNNDMVAMTLAAKMSRMELDDFAELISKNSSSLAGLGGSVVRGAENFHKVADEFHKSDAKLRMLGYTTDEMNEF